MRKWIMMVVALTFLASLCLGCAGHALPGAGKTAALSTPVTGVCQPSEITCKFKGYDNRPVMRSVGDQPGPIPQQGL